MPRAHRFVRNSFWVWITFCVAANLTDFVPSAAFIKAGVRFAQVTTVPLTLWYWYVAWTRGPADYGIVKKLVASLVAPGLIFVFMYVGLVEGLPGLVGRYVGEKTEQLSVAEKGEHSTRSRRWGTTGCRYQLYGGVLDGGFLNLFCISEEAFKALPRKPKIRVAGYSSWLGLLVTEIYDASDVAHISPVWKS